jgi:hypothetical protein
MRTPRGGKALSRAASGRVPGPSTTDSSLNGIMLLIIFVTVLICVEIKIYGAFVLNHRVVSTPSTRRLHDGVAMPVPRRSTEPGRPHHCREMT